MARVWFTEDGELKTEMIPEQEIYMDREKLVPFDIEEARKDLSRVRWAWGGKPLHVFLNDPTCAVSLVEANGARHCYNARHFADRLRLVAAPKKAHYAIIGSHFTGIRPYVAPVDAGRGPRADVRDVKYDKATGILTVEYYE